MYLCAYTFFFHVRVHPSSKYGLPATGLWLKLIARGTIVLAKNLRCIGNSYASSLYGLNYWLGLD